MYYLRRVLTNSIWMFLLGSRAIAWSRAVVAILVFQLHLLVVILTRNINIIMTCFEGEPFMFNPTFVNSVEEFWRRGVILCYHEVAMINDVLPV